MLIVKALGGREGVGRMDEKGKGIMKYKLGPGWVAPLVEASSRTPKGFQFDPQSEHTSRLWV